jgi:hypothetical protein
MKFNAWVEIRDDFTWPADDPADDTELQAKNRETLALCGDIEVIPNLFNTRIAGGNWQVYSLLYEFPDDTPNPDQAIEQALELFKSENPGQTDVLACWYEEGNMVGTTLVVTEEPNPEYVGEPFMIPNPDYQPDPEAPDYDPRTEIRNPAYVPPTITVKSQTGVPLYDTTLRDVNLYAGQPTRVFS